MPRVKTPEAPFIKMRRLLLGYDLNGPALAKVMNCSPKTARDRLEHPEKLTLANLHDINTKGHVPIEELKDAMAR